MSVAVLVAAAAIVGAGITLVLTQDGSESRATLRQAAGSTQVAGSHRGTRGTSTASSIGPAGALATSASGAKAKVPVVLWFPAGGDNTPWNLYEARPPYISERWAGGEFAGSKWRGTKWPHGRLKWTSWTTSAATAYGYLYLTNGRYAVALTLSRPQTVHDTGNTPDGQRELAYWAFTRIKVVFESAIPAHWPNETFRLVRGSPGGMQGFNFPTNSY